MAYDLGTVKGSVSIDVAQAIAAYASVRRANAATDTALLESSRSLRTVGAGLLGIGALALAGFGVAVKTAADFYAKMKFFQVITGATKKEMDAVIKKHQELARTSGYTANEIADAFVELGKAGIDAKQIIGGVADAAAQLGAAAQIPLKDSAEVIVNTMKTFQLGAGEAVHIADLLAGAANASTIDITDLAYSLKYVGGTAAALGVPLADTINALGQLGNAGIRGSTGGTALRKILLQLAPTTRQAVQELEKLGIIQTNGGVTADKYAKLQDRQKTAVDNLRKAQQHLLEVERLQQAAQSSGGTSGAASAAKAAAASERLAAARQRLAAAEQHLQSVQAKYSSSGSLANTAAKQATMFDRLQAAQNRVAAAQLHLQQVETKNASSPGGGSNAAKQIRAQYQLQQAQERVAEAADKARKAGVAVAPGIEKITNLFFKANGTAKPLAEIFQILQDHMKGLTQQQKVQAAELIFGNRAISSALILTTRGAKGFAEFNKQMKQVTAADVMRKRLDTLQGSLKKLRGALSVAFINLGAPAQKPLQIIVQLITRLVNAFAELPAPVQSVLAGLIVLFGTLTAGLGAFILMVSFVGKAVRAYREFKQALAFVKEIQLLQRAFALLNITMLANPVVLIVVAILALIAVLVILIIKVKPVREFFIHLGKDIAGAFMAVVRFVQRIPKYFEEAWNGIKRGVGAFIGWIKRNWVDILIVVLGGFLAPAILIWKHFHTQIINFVVRMVKDVAKFFAALPKAVLEAFITVNLAILKFFAALPGQVLYWFGFIVGITIRWIVQMVALAVRLGLEFTAGVINFFTALPGRIVALMQALYRGVVAIAHALVSTAKWLGSQFLHFVVWYFTQLPIDIYKLLLKSYQFVIRFFTAMYTTAIRWARAIFTDVIHWFSQLPGNVVKLLTEVWDALINTGADLINTMGQIGEGSVQAIMNFFNNLPQLIFNALKAALNTVKNLFKDAYKIASGWGGSLWNGFKHGLGIKSPSYIEKAMFAITKTMDTESAKIAKSVRQVNALSGGLPKSTPLMRGTGAHRVLGAAASGSPGAMGAVHKEYHVEVNYPEPSKAEEAVPRVLRNLDFVGAI